MFQNFLLGSGIKNRHASCRVVHALRPLTVDGCNRATSKDVTPEHQPVYDAMKGRGAGQTSLTSLTYTDSDVVTRDLPTCK